MPGSPTTPGRPGTRDSAPVRVAFRDVETRRHPGHCLISRLNGWPVRSPADASPAPSRMPTHGSGPMWFATPSSWWTFTTYSLPVSRRTDNLDGRWPTCRRYAAGRVSRRRGDYSTAAVDRCTWEEPARIESQPLARWTTAVSSSRSGAGC